MCVFFCWPPFSVGGGGGGCFEEMVGKLDNLKTKGKGKLIQILVEAKE